MNKNFQVGFTADFVNKQGQTTFKDIGTGLLDAQPGLDYGFIEKRTSPIQPVTIRDYDAIVSLAPPYTAESFQGVDRLIVISRFGVGYDMVDVDACTEADILLCITSGAVDIPMAEATVSWMLALSHRVLLKDRLLRESRWGDKANAMGTELRDRTLGIIGLGGIGKTLVKVLSAFGMNQPLAFDPFVSDVDAEKSGVKLVALEELLQESDFVSIHCPLTEGTRSLLGAEQLALMKPEAFLINTARGGIVEETALIDALQKNRIAGAAIDVFDEEPADGKHPYAQLDNVILAPHCIGWTEELFRDIGRMACQAVIDTSHGQIPAGVVNKEVLERPGFQKKLGRWR